MLEAFIKHVFPQFCKESYSETIKKLISAITKLNCFSYAFSTDYNV